jgi:isocitrate dehydrogenase (NAD+)
LIIERKLADGLFLNVCKEVAKQYESHGIKMKDMIVDNAAMQLVSKPQQFDVILCGNLYGNILTNVGSALVGGPGVVPGVNVGREFVVFEPGCRHVGRDLEGMNAANPATMIMSSAHLLFHIGLPQYGKQISQALMAVLGESTDLTKDLGGKTGTREFTQNVIRHL